MKVTKLYAENVHGYLPIDIKFFDDLTFLTGLNGSGKTSALRLLMALLTPNINELGAIAFSLAQVTVFDNDKEVVVSATKRQATTMFSEHTNDSQKTFIQIPLLMKN